MEDLILIITLLGAHPDLRSIWIGGSMSIVALLLLYWVQGYTVNWSEPAVVGPFRFVRHPLRLGLWLLAIGFSLGSRSFPGLLLSLGLLPLLYHFDLEREEEQKKRQNLAAFRYGKFVPALVPTIFPYRLEHALARPTFSWRGGLLGSDRNVRRRLGRLILGWAVIGLALRDLLPEHGLAYAAAFWAVFLIIRTGLHRKTLRLVFTP